MDDSTENGRIIRRSRTRKQASGIGSVCGCPGRRRRRARHDIRPDRRQDDGLRNRLRRKEDDRKPHRAVSRRKINRRDIKVQAMVLARDAVGRRPAAFVAGMSAIVRILVAETQHRTAGNGNERRHRHHHDGGESPRPSAETHCSHDVNYTTISVNRLSTGTPYCQKISLFHQRFLTLIATLPGPHRETTGSPCFGRAPPSVTLTGLT